MILTYLWPWNKAKVIKPGINCSTVSKVIIMQSLKDLPKAVPSKKPVLKVLSNQKTSIISPEYVQTWKIVVYLLFTWLPKQSDKVST